MSESNYKILSREYEGELHASLQWKGTFACMDFHCPCGAHLHFDDEFLYYIKCGHCKNIYEVGYNVKVLKVEKSLSGNEKIEYDDRLNNQRELDSLGLDGN